MTYRHKYKKKKTCQEPQVGISKKIFVQCVFVNVCVGGPVTVITDRARLLPAFPTGWYMCWFPACTNKHAEEVNAGLSKHSSAHIIKS